MTRFGDPDVGETLLAEYRKAFPEDEISVQQKITKYRSATATEKPAQKRGLNKSSVALSFRARFPLKFAR